MHDDLNRVDVACTGELLDIERVTISSERGGWKSACPGNSLAAYSTSRPVLRGPGGSNTSPLPDQALETKQKFISQVMTGESAVRRAEDIGQEALSFAEVKAIASGNPAVLTLAEADAELQRLAILKKNHADEQYLARRSLRELPDTIDRLGKSLAALRADLSTAGAHERDPLVLAGRSYHPDDALTALGRELNAIPEKVRETRSFPLGQYRGLTFGIILHGNGAADVYLEGATTRHGMLSRDHRGPRAVMNALERLVGGFTGQCEKTAQDLSIAQGQLRDHKARLGVPFAHEAYLSELSELREKLKIILSATGTEPGAESLPPAAKLAERIQALKASQVIELAPERRLSSPRAEAPVTARVRQRTDSPQAIKPETPDVSPATPAPAELRPTVNHSGAVKLEEFAVPILPRLQAARNLAGKSRTMRQTRFQPDRQLSLF